MSNQFQNISDGVWNLKKWYQGPLVDQFSEDNNLYRFADKSKYKFDGEEVRRPLRVRRNPGIGATSDGGNLPKIGRQVGVQAVIAAKYNYLRFGITGPMIKAAMSDKGSFVRMASYELEMGYKDVEADCNRQITWDGTSDLAQLNAGAAASNSIVVKGRESTEPALKFLDVGMSIDIYTGTTLTASNVTINSISGTATGATATLVLDTAVTVSANDIVVRAGSFGNEVQGILTQLDGGTTTVFGIDRASYIQTQGNSISLSSNQLTLDALTQLDNLTMQRGGAKGGGWYSDFDSSRYYQKLIEKDKRYTNSIEGDGGFTRKGEKFMDFNGKPWVVDKDCPLRIFRIPEGCLEKNVLCEMEFADESGTMYIAQTGVDAYEVRVRLFFNMFNTMAAASGVLSTYVSP